MTLAQLRQFFRQKIKVVSGGPPVGTVGSNRAQGQLDALDALAEFASQQGGSNLATRDLLDLTTEFMDAVMALTYTDCDADPAASPDGSFPGQQFDAVGADGQNRHYYCTRSTYIPGINGSGVGPAWHCVQKLR